MRILPFSVLLYFFDIPKVLVDSFLEFAELLDNSVFFLSDREDDIQIPRQCFSTEVVQNKPHSLSAGFAASKLPLKRFLACVPT